MRTAQDIADELRRVLRQQFEVAKRAALELASDMDRQAHHINLAANRDPVNGELEWLDEVRAAVERVNAETAPVFHRIRWAVRQEQDVSLALRVAEMGDKALCPVCCESLRLVKPGHSPEALEDLEDLCGACEDTDPRRSER